MGFVILEKPALQAFTDLPGAVLHE